MADDDTGAGSAAAADSGGDKPEAKQDDKLEGKEDPKPEGKRASSPVDDADAGPERRDRFAEAAGDPLADALGGSSAQAWEGQARRSWMRTVHASGAAAFVGGGSIGVLNITTSSSAAHSRVGQAPGRLRDEAITELVSRYVPVPGYAALVSRLRSTRLLVLRGAPGTGRSTTGLRLLAKLVASVARFGPDTDFRALTDADLEPDTGYLLELDPGSGFLPPTPADVDRVRGCLAGRQSYLVVVAPHDIRYRDGFDGSITDCPLPDPREVFDQAVDYEIGHRPGEEAALRKIAARAQPGITAGPQTPSEVRWYVAHLMSAPDADYSEADLEILNGALAARYVSSWFEPLSRLPVTAGGDEPVRLAAFRIALAVLNGGPLDLVAETAEDLARRLLEARARRRTISLPVFAHHRENYVANSRASATPGTVRFIEATAPAQMLAYDDDRLPLAVLRHVWDVHNLRGLLLAWLQSLSDDRRPLMYWPAALTIGLLTSWDFSYTFHEWIQPWASSDQARRRWTAAVALDEAARNADVRPVVQEMLGEWREKGTFEQRWTCAIALGFDLGLRDPPKAVTDLRKLASWEDGQLTAPASWAVARILVLSGITPVIATISGWLEDDRRSVRLLGLVVIQRIADIKVGELEDNLELTAMNDGGYWTRLASRRRWPLLLALADDDPALLDPLADLMWHLARSAGAEKATTDTLTRWIRATRKDPACTGPLGRFLALMGDDDTDRARLLHLLRSLRRDPDEPLPAAVADRLERAIAFNIHTTQETR